MQARRGARWGGLAAAAFWLAAAGAPAEPSVRVAVLPVVVHTADDHHYLRDGLSDMLAARLARSGTVAVIRVEDAALATTRAEDARATARKLGADYALFGSFTRFGEGASLDLQCLAVSGKRDREPRAIFIQAGSLGQIIPRVDQLADKVLRYVSGAAPETDASNGAEAPAASNAAADLRDALVQLEAVQERLEALEATVYRQQREAAPEGAPQEGPEDVSESAPPLPGRELSAAQGDAAPLP